MPDLISVLIVDDDPVICRGLSAIINATADLTVAGVAPNGKEALSLAEKTNPNIALVDVNMPDMDGVETTRQFRLRFPQIAVIILTAFEQEGALAQCLSQGARAFLTKDTPPQKLIGLVRRISEGDTVISSNAAKVLTKVLGQQFTAANTEIDRDFAESVAVLPKHLRPVFDLLAQAKTNKEIAANLHLSTATVRSYSSDIYMLTGCAGKGELAIRAHRANLSS
ncbi:MAG: response regulator transcription factor [Actinomycetaceae bacterium]|nr:response regulator transcription factor [Actinomycetaceae bacterium]